MIVAVPVRGCIALNLLPRLPHQLLHRAPERTAARHIDQTANPGKSKLHQGPAARQQCRIVTDADLSERNSEGVPGRKNGVGRAPRHAARVLGKRLRFPDHVGGQLQQAGALDLRRAFTGLLAQQPHRDEPHCGSEAFGCLLCVPVE